MSKVKVTLTLTQGQYDDLRTLAENRGVTLSTFVTRGIALQKFLFENADSELLIKRGDNLHELVLVG